MTQQDTAAERFAEWFRQNYPGPHTIIGRPDWHAPKIYRAATHELRKELDEVHAERAALREALKRIACGEYDGLEVTRLNATQCRVIARAALTGEAKP